MHDLQTFGAWLFHCHLRSLSLAFIVVVFSCFTSEHHIIEAANIFGKSAGSSFVDGHVSQAGSAELSL